MQAVDLFDSATFEREVPHDYFAWLRENEPVHWQPPCEPNVNLEELAHPWERQQLGDRVRRLNVW